MGVLVTSKHAAETDAFERAVEIMQNFGFIKKLMFLNGMLESKLWKAQ